MEGMSEGKVKGKEIIMIIETRVIGYTNTTQERSIDCAAMQVEMNHSVLNHLYFCTQRTAC